VLAAYRRRARTAHPDAGGSAEDFVRLAEARDWLLTHPCQG
jgi:curved DNA-binding protein CbpA